jgi:hypothetical protein
LGFAISFFASTKEIIDHAFGSAGPSARTAPKQVGVISFILTRAFRIPLLDPRFTAIKQSLVAPQHKAKVIASYERLCEVLEKEAEFIAKTGPSIVPEIDFNDVCENGKLHRWPKYIDSKSAI